MEIYAGINRILVACRDTGAVRSGYLTDAPERLRLRPPRRKVPYVIQFPGKLTLGPAVKIG